MDEQKGTFELAVTLGNSSFSASGDPDLVLRMFGEFKELAAATPDPPSRAERREPTESAKPSGGGSTVDTTNLPLKPFLSRLELRGNRERATAMIAWSAESGGAKQLTITQINELWKKTSFKAPSNLGNLGRDVRSAAKEGWLDSEGTGKDEVFSINGYGDGVVAGWATSKR